MNKNQLHNGIKPPTSIKPINFDKLKPLSQQKNNLLKSSFEKEQKVIGKTLKSLKDKEDYTRNTELNEIAHKNKIPKQFHN